MKINRNKVKEYETQDQILATFPGIRDTLS